MEDQPKTQLTEWTFLRVVWSTLLVVLVILCFGAVYRFYQVIFILFAAIVMATVIRPVVTWLNNRGIPRLVGVILVYLVVLGFIIGFALLLFPLIINQGTAILSEVPGYYQIFRDWMVNSTNGLLLLLGDYLPRTLPLMLPLQQTGEQILSTTGQALSILTSTANGIFLSIVFLLMTLHWTLEGPRIIQSLLQLLPKNKRQDINDMLVSMETKLAYYIAGKTVLSLVIGIMALVAYLIIGLPDALVLALVAGLFEAVPMVGPTLGAIPAAIIALTISPTHLIWVIVATMVFQTLENNLLVPRVMSKAVGVNPFVSLVAIFAFSLLFGMAGALLAIPIAAILQILLDHFVFHTGTPESVEYSGRDRTSRLRYEAQELASDLRKQARINKDGSTDRIDQIDEVMDEVEAITTDLDELLAQLSQTEVP